MDYEKLNRIYNSRDKYEGGYWTDIDSGTTVYDTIGFMEQEAKMQEENSVLNNTLTAIGNGAKGSVRGLLGAAKAAIDTNIEIHKKADPNYQPYNDFAPGISKSLQSGIDSLKREEIKADSAVGELGYNLIEGAVQLVGQYAVTAATGGVGGAAYMGANIAGDQYIDLREQGVDAERAAQAGLMNAPFQAALERVGFNKIFGKIPANSPARKKAMQVFESAITEGFTEGLQELPQQLTNIWAKDKNATAESMAQKWGDDWEQNVKEAGYSALIGGILGGGASGIRVIAGSVGDHIAEKATEVKKEQLVEQVEKIKASGVAPDYAAAYVDANSDGATVTVEAKDVAAWKQTANISDDKAEEILGVSADEINQAAANGTDIDISRGNFIKAMISDNSLFEMTKDGMIFDQSGDLSTRGLELKKELREAYAGADELNLELDNELNNVIDSAIGAGMAKTHAENLRVLLASRAMIANPENPAEWLRKNKLRFENVGKAGKNKGGWLQSVGEHAKSANKEQLKAAKEMAANGADEKEIYKKTGWHRGVDGKWRFEIPDNIDGIDVDILQSQGDEGISLQDLYHNDALFAAYPELKNVNIFKETMEGNTLGYANGNENKIALRKEIVEIRALKNFADFMGRVKSDIESSNVEDKEAIVSLIDKAVANPSAVTDADIKKISSAISGQFYNDNIKSIDFDSLLFGAEPGDVAPETKVKETFDYIKNYVEDIEQSRNKLKRKLGEVLTHEIQHIIQAQEGFAKGGSQRSVRKNLDEAGVGYNPELKDLDLYWNLAGEQEARRTGTLAQMQSEMRRLKEQESPDAKKIEELQNKIDELVLGTNDKDSAIVYFGDKPVVSYSEEGTVEKGQIAPQDDGSYIVSLFKGADASTVIHETGHYFVDTLVNEAVANPENEALVRDAKVLLEYGGMTIEEWQTADVESKRNAHEILANAFESYIMEGKAPSLSLRSAFRRFANWLSAIYAKIARAPEAKELTPEVREVFDAMFASRAEIETVSKLDGIFGTIPGTENLSDTSKFALQDKIMQARDMAVEILTKEVMKNFNAERRRRKAEYEKEVRAIVEKDILNEQVIQARQVVADNFAKEHWKTKLGWIEKNGRLYSARIKDKQIMLKANPAIIASKYKHVLGNELPNYADQLKYINAEINSRIGDIVEELKEGVKEYRTYGEFWTDNETGEIIDVGDLVGKEELEFDAGMNGNNYRTKHTADTDVDNWYTRFRKTEGKRYPTVKEMVEIARDIYAGEDKYGYYQGGIDFALKNATAEEIAEYEAEMAARKAELDELFAVKEAIEKNKEIVNISKRSALSDDERLAFDMLAESLGYDSGDAMATDILEAPTEGQMIRERVDALVKAKFPDILSERKYAEEKAREAIYNDESGELVALEQVLIEEMINKQVDNEAKKQVRKEVSEQLKKRMRIVVDEAVKGKPLKEILDEKAFKAEARWAAQNAKKANRQGREMDADKFQEQERIANAKIENAKKVKRKVDAAQRYIKGMLKSKRRNWVSSRHFNQMAMLLERMGLNHKEYTTASEHFWDVPKENLQKYIADMKKKYGDAVEVSEFVLNPESDLSNLENLTPEQLEDVVNALRTIRTITKLEREEARANKLSKEERLAKAKAIKQTEDICAKNYMAGMSVEDAINVRKHAAAERRAAADAKKAAKLGLFTEAAICKRQQIFLHAVTRKSIEARNKVKSSQRYLRKQLRAKKEAWHHQRHFNQACALLARMGLKHKGYDPATNQESLAGYVAEMAERYGGFVDISDFVLDANNDLSKPKELTMEQYMDVIDALKNIRAIANLEAKGIKDGQEATFAEEKKVILDELNKLETRYVPEVGSDKKTGIKGALKNIKEKPINYLSRLLNTDNFYLFMDNWTDGYFTKHWYDVQTRCANKEAEMVMDYQDRAIKAYNKWAPDDATKKAMDEKKSYKELNGISISKNDMIGLLVNLGNEGNAYRLCSTPPLGLEKSGIWVAPDETLNVEQAAELTRQNLLAFLNKYLTKADIDYAQARIDNCDRFWQEVEALNLRTKGFAPPKVNAVPTIFKLADGQEVVFKGGYFPLKRDSRLGSMPAGQNRINSTEELGGSGIETMSTTAGSSKNRMKGAKYSVSLEPGSEHKAVMDTIHDICYREAMIGFRKVLNDEEIFATLKMKLGETKTRLLKEQLLTCANPSFESKVFEGEHFMAGTARLLRRVSTNAAIMLNLKTALQNVGNVLLYGNSVEGFGYADTLVAMQRAISGADRAEIDAICAKSIFLKERMETPDFTLRDIRNRDDLNPIEKRTLKWGAWLLGYTDMLTAKPVYAQAYAKKINEGATEQEAIEFADKVIRRTLGSGRAQDIASLQRGSDLFKALTMFQGFFNTQFNQWYREAHIVNNMRKDGNKKEAVMRLSAFMASKYLLACLVNLMISELSFTEPFEDDDDGWNKLSKELLNYPLSMGGPVGQVANVALQNFLGISNYGYRLTPIQATIDKTFTAIRNIGEVVRGEKDWEETVEPVIHIGGNYVGIPSSVFNILFNLVDVASGEMDLHATDFLRRRPKAERDLDEE